MELDHDVQYRLSQAVWKLSQATAHEIPGEVAAYLERCHITGIPGNPCYCPVAVFVAKELALPSDCWVNAGNCHVTVYRGRDSEQRLIASTICPDSIAEFMAFFDNGHYLALIKKVS